MSLINGIVMGSDQYPMYIRASSTSGNSIPVTFLPPGATRFVAVSSADITDTSSQAVKTAGGAGVVFYITSITVSNMSPTVATRVNILDGSTVIWQGPAAAAGGGFCATFPIVLVGTANTAINAQCGTTGAAVRVAIAGYQI